MKAKRITAYTKHGCNFTGPNLVLVEYFKDMTKDPAWGQFNANLTDKYIRQAAALVVQEFGEPVRVLLAMPDYVCEVRADGNGVEQPTT